MNKKIIALTGLLYLGCSEYVKPDIINTKDNSVEKLSYKIKKEIESECDRSYITKIKGNTLIICDEKIDNKYRQKFGLPLEKICDVNIEERHFPPVIECLWNDVLIVKTEDSYFQIKLPDQKIKNVGSLLADYIKSTGNECQDNIQEEK